MTPEAKSQALAAAVILAAAFLVIQFLPNIVLSIGAFSPLLGFVAGALLLSAFFVVLWLRARHQRRKGH